MKNTLHKMYNVDIFWILLSLPVVKFFTTKFAESGSRMSEHADGAGREKNLPEQSLLKAFSTVTAGRSGGGSAEPRQYGRKTFKGRFRQ